ncbi:MAG: glycosyltransferase family 4 protein [bacterium]|nr:glycosyltransferase family 4 protein [bacterium]
MKIVHLCLGAFFPDGYSYQENMLPKFHQKMGYDVEVIASLVTFDKDGYFTLYPQAKTYQNEYGIRVTRLDYKKPRRLYQPLRRFEGLQKALEEAAPDILFIHNCQFMDIDVVTRYVANRPMQVYVDNHADYSNSAKNPISRWILHGLLWKHCAHVIEPYTARFYGVLPARVDFLKDVYHLPAEKCELLVMGADDEAVQAASAPEVRRAIRDRYGIGENDFLVMTGGKIDAYKTQTLLLMEAVRGIENSRVKLLVFGSVTPDLKEKVTALADGEKVQYIGWIKAEDSYGLFAAAELAVFPGRHSVFWEQVAAQGIPMLVKDWPGTHHVDLGGNVRFLTKDSAEEIQEWIIRLSDRSEAYQRMKDIATNKGMYAFSYARIARAAIEI